MRKVISLIVLGALCVVLFSSPTQALPYDPEKRQSIQARSVIDSGDDDPLGVDKGGAPTAGGDIRFSLIFTAFDLILIYVIEAIDQSDESEATTEAPEGRSIR